MEWYEIVKVILEILGLVVALVPTLVAFFALIKNIIKNKDWKLIEQIAKAAMTKAEEYAKEHPNMTGDEKLEYALEIVKSGLNEAGIEFNEDLIKQIVAYINELCSWSKTVNSKNK